MKILFAVTFFLLGVVRYSNAGKKPTPKPTPHPTAHPSAHPSAYPSANPSANPSSYPSEEPSSEPSENPSVSPSAQPTEKPSAHPSSYPSMSPTSEPSEHPSNSPSVSPSLSFEPSMCPIKETVILTKAQALHNSLQPTIFEGYYIEQQTTSNIVLYSGRPNDGKKCILWESGNMDHPGAYYTRLDEDGILCTRPGNTEPATTPCLWQTDKKKRKFIWDHVVDYYFAVGTSFTHFGNCQDHVYIMSGTPGNADGLIWSEPTYPSCGKPFVPHVPPHDAHDPPPIPTPTYHHVPAPVAHVAPFPAPYASHYPDTVLMKSKDVIKASDGALYFSSADVSIVQKDDGNFIVYRGKTEHHWLWMSGYTTKYLGPHYTRLQSDGNLLTRPGVWADRKGIKSVWKTGSKGEEGTYYLVLSSDKTRLSIRKGSVSGQIVWSVNTR